MSVVVPFSRGPIPLSFRGKGEDVYEDPTAVIRVDSI